MEIGSALLGLLGALIGVLSNFGIEWYKNRQRAKEIAALVAAEIAVQIEQADDRGYLEGFRNIVVRLKSTGTAQYSDFLINGAEVNPLYDMIKSEIGLLGSTFSYKIARYYLNTNSIRSDLKRFAGQSLNKNTHLYLVEGNIKFWEQTRSEGLKLVSELKAWSKRT